MTVVIENPNRSVVQLIVLTGAVKLYSKTGMLPNRHQTVGNLLKLAGEWTGKKYPRSRSGAALAYQHLVKVKEEMGLAQ